MALECHSCPEQKHMAPWNKKQKLKLTHKWFGWNLENEKQTIDVIVNNCPWCGVKLAK